MIFIFINRVPVVIPIELYNVFFYRRFVQFISNSEVVFKKSEAFLQSIIILKNILKYFIIDIIFIISMQAIYLKDRLHTSNLILK